MDAQEKFIEAFQRLDIKTLSQLPIETIDVNCYNEIGRTALHYAVEHNNPELAKFLLEHGAEERPIITLPSEGIALCRPLPLVALAIYHENNYLLNLLLTYGINPDTIVIEDNDHSFITPWVLALIKNNQEAFMMLAESSAVYQSHLIVRPNDFQRPDLKWVSYLIRVKELKPCLNLPKALSVILQCGIIATSEEEALLRNLLNTVFEDKNLELSCFMNDIQQIKTFLSSNPHHDLAAGLLIAAGQGHSELVDILAPLTVSNIPHAIDIVSLIMRRENNEATNENKMIHYRGIMQTLQFLGKFWVRMILTQSEEYPSYFNHLVSDLKKELVSFFTHSSP